MTFLVPASDRLLQEQLLLANMEEPLKITRANAYDASGFWTRLSMTWLMPLLKVGFSKELQPQDLYTCSVDDDPSVMAEALER